MADMNKKTFGAAAIVATLLSVGTYVLLNTLLPYKPEELKVADVADLDEVMGGSLSTTAPEGHAASDAQSIPAAETPPAETATEMAADTGAEDAATSDATADIAAADAGTASEPAVAESAAEPAPAAEPAAEPAQVATAESAPAVEAAPAAAPKPRKAKPAAQSPAKSGMAPTKQYAPTKDLKQWWGTAADGSLSVAYAGSLANKSAVVLMFTGAFDSADSINQHVKVKSSGGAVGGQWEISPNNKRMALFTVPAKGRYLISVNRGVTDRSGRKLGSAVQGPVYVQ